MLDLLFSPEVAEARVARRPFVALESTLIAHGLPWPDNLEVALELEREVRDAGATPATIAIVDGPVRIGLSRELLERVAHDGAELAKAGAADLAVHLARGTSAATTVSATSVLAARAGIRVFATGGIGGVHRGDAGDVSHDLVALARTPVAVVSAGAKAILDLPRTAELLETLGVLVVGYRTDELPAFYTAHSGVRLDHTVGELPELARILHHHWDDLDGGGVLVCNLAGAPAGGVSGMRHTPYGLARLGAATGGGSIRANRALALNDARVAAELAVALAGGTVPAADRRGPAH